MNTTTKKSGDDFSLLANDSGEGFAVIGIDEIIVNKQIRTDFPEASLKELSESIKTVGIIQPLAVRMVGADYELIAGERRLRAAKMAGLASVPVKIFDVDDETAKAMQRAENIQREDLTLIDLSTDVKKELEAAKGDRSVVMKKYGKGEAWLSKILGLQNLPPEAKALLVQGVTKDVEVASIVATAAKQDKKTGGDTAKKIVEAVVKEAAKKPADRKPLRDVAKDTAAASKPAKPPKAPKTEGIADPYTADLGLGKPVEKAFGNVPIAKGTNGGGEKRAEITEVLVDCSRHFKAIDDAIAELKSFGNISESARGEIADKLEALKARALGLK